MVFVNFLQNCINNQIIAAASCLQSQSSCFCLCIIDCMTNLEKCCILASSDPLLHFSMTLLSQSYSKQNIHIFLIQLLFLRQRGEGRGTLLLHPKLFKLKKGSSMVSPFAKGKVDSVELIIKDPFQFSWMILFFILVSNWFLDFRQGCNVRKVNCGCVYSAYILKPVLSGRNL